MQTKAARIYGKNDVRLDVFELPELKEDEIRAKIITDSMCMSTYKLTVLGEEHKRAPKDLAQNPAVLGHEMCGIIEEVGEKWKDKYEPGQKFIMQTAMLNDDNLYSAGFSYPYFGGNAAYINIPSRVMENDYLLPYTKDAYYFGSLAEPMACICAAFHASYHIDPFTYEHKMGIVPGGNLALLASAGPMGLGAIEYAICADRKPSVIYVTDIDEKRLSRARSVITPEYAQKHGVELHYINTNELEDPVSYLKEASGGGFDDVFVMAPVPSVITQGDALLREDGCLNFFAGPTNTELMASINFFNVHYSAVHIAGTTGSRLCDMEEVVKMMNEGRLDPTPMITHIGGLSCVPQTVLDLPNIPGGKKLIYNHIDMPLTAIDDFEEVGKSDLRFKKLAEITKKHNGLWSGEAEEYLLANM